MFQFSLLMSDVPVAMLRGRLAMQRAELLRLACLDIPVGSALAIALGTAESKYSGAAAVGTTVFFAPYNEETVGVLDTTTSSFSTIGTTAAGVTANYKYWGAAAVSTSVYFAPCYEDNVGVVLASMV